MSIDAEPPAGDELQLLSPLRAEDHELFDGLPYFDYDPDARVLAEITETEPRRYEIGTSGEGAYFNFAYNPSCSYDPAWVCPLATPPNRLAVPIEAGGRHPNGAAPAS